MLIKFLEKLIGICFHSWTYIDTRTLDRYLGAYEKIYECRKCGKQKVKYK